MAAIAALSCSICVSAIADVCGAQEVRDARKAFNKGIAEHDLDAISALLDDDVMLITGTDSDVFVSKPSQMALWQSDSKNVKALLYVRETSEVQLSPLYPMAMESGLWTGKAPSGDELGGEYAAKWRCDGVRWMLEAEIFMTTRCSGALCADPK